MYGSVPAYFAWLINVSVAVFRFADPRRFRDTEIQNPRHPVRPDHHVLGFEISMDDTSFVGCSQTVRNLSSYSKGFMARQRSCLQQCSQALAFNEFGDDVKHAVLASYVVDGQQIRVVQFSKTARLALWQDRIRVLAQDLDGNVAAQTCVTCAVNLPIPADPIRSLNS